MAVDHCFSIRGQGTVITGTILQGALRVNDTLEIPALKVHRCITMHSCILSPTVSTLLEKRIPHGFFRLVELFCILNFSVLPETLTKREIEKLECAKWNLNSVEVVK